MLSDTAARHAGELRHMLDTGRLTGTDPIEVDPGQPIDAALAARLVLADVDHLGRAGITSRARWRNAEEYIERVHRIVAR